jgi:hypothetical protein
LHKRPLSVHVHFPMSQPDVRDFFDDDPSDGPLGSINEVERWWVERQEALERAGYMLRPRYRPGWKPSWEGTKKFYFQCEDGQNAGVRDISCLLIRY